MPNLNTSMKQQNEKPRLCLIHGWGASNEIWQPWLDQLSESFTISCISVPGLGDHQLSDSTLTIEAALDKLAVKIPRNSFLVGWSLGGMLATLLSSRQELAIKGLITISCNPSFVQQVDWPNAMPLEQFNNFTVLLAKNVTKTLSRFFALQVQGGSDGKSILTYLKTINDDAKHTHLSETLGFLLHDNRSQLLALKQPSLHFFGEFDQLVPVAVSDEIPSLNSMASSVVIKKAGHVPFLSDGEMMAKKISAFCVAQGTK